LQTAGDNDAMNKLKPKMIRLFKFLLAILILWLVAMALVPKLINLESVKQRISAQLSRDFGSDIRYRRLQLSYFPKPHVVIHRAQVQIPDSFAIEIHRMKIYPKIVPLLKGDLQIAVIRLDYADYFMKLPQVSSTASESGQSTSLDDVVEFMQGAVQNLPAFRLPDLNLKIHHAKINLIDPFGRMFKLREVQGQYHRSHDKLDIFLQCKSNLWDRITINALLNPSNLEGRGNILLSRFRPQQLFAYLFPDSAIQVTDTKANVTIDFELDGIGTITADVQGAIPSLALKQGQQELTIEGCRIRGTFEIGGKAVRAAIEELRLDYPQLKVAATFSYEEHQPNIRIAIEGSQIDAETVRHTALRLAGESQTIRNIFDIIRGGQVPWITVEVRGQTMAELGMLDNIVIKGRMIQGKIFIPGVELDLEDVIGDAIISEGILKGENLQACTGNSCGSDGRMILALSGNAAPFQLGIGVNADLSQLPPVLRRIVDDKDFLDELGRITELKGNATGTLTLGDDLASLNAKVDVSKVQLEARYKRIPYPVRIEGGTFVYAGTSIVLDNFNTNIGKSSLLQLSSSIKWTGTPSLAISSKKANFDLTELHSWLLSLDTFQKKLNNISSLQGYLSLQNLNIKGPFFNPQEWRFQTRGAFTNLIINSDSLPQSLRIARGRFSWRENNISLNDVDATMGRSSVSQLSAGFDLKHSSLSEVRAEGATLFAAEIYPWLKSLPKIPSAFQDFSATAGIMALQGLNIKGPLLQPEQWQYALTCEMQNLVLSSAVFEKPLIINDGALVLAGKPSAGTFENEVKVKTTNLAWEGSQMRLKGSIESFRNDILLDMTVTASGIRWSQVKSFLDYIRKKNADSGAPESRVSLKGSLDIRMDKFNYDSFAVLPLHAEVTFNPDEVAIAVNRASICGISLQGLLKVAGESMDIYLVPTAIDQQLSTAVYCITGEQNLAAGTYQLKGELLSKSKPHEILRSVSGEAAFSAESGRIYRFGLLAKILALLNVTEIYRGEVPDLTGEGFAYNRIKASAEIRGGKLIMKECTIDGVSMGIVCEGDIDLADKKMDLLVLVAPFKTVDRIVNLLPLIGHVLGGKLISIPFRAKGDLKDPSVTPISPTAVGTEVLGILERTLKLPIAIIQPLISGAKNQKSIEENDIDRR
jgi:hypothetical protein